MAWPPSYISLRNTELGIQSSDLPYLHVNQTIYIVTRFNALTTTLLSRKPVKFERIIHILRVRRPTDWDKEGYFFIPSLQYSLKKDVQRKNVINNVAISSLSAPWQNGPCKNQHTERRKTLEHHDRTYI